MILECTKISKLFGGLKALNDVSFKVKSNEILALIGPNGAGKTTLFNIIAGHYKTNEGSIIFNGTDITNYTPSKICKIGIARTFQIPQPFKGLTIIENIYIGYNFGNPEIKNTDYIIKIMKLLNLYVDKDKLIDNVTVEKQKKVEIARALATCPKLLLLDEIAAGLNYKEQDELNEIIKNIRANLGITVIIIEHIMRMVMNLADRIIVLNQGKFLTSGSPENISNNPDVIKAYLGEEYVSNVKS